MEQHLIDADARRLSETLERLRTGQRLSQADLARLSGVSRATISIIERAYDPKKRGAPRPHADTLNLLAKGLATDGKGQLHPELQPRFYAELMAAAGYLPAEGAKSADLGDTALLRSDTEIERWMAEQVGEHDLALAYARVLTERRYLTPADQVGLDSVVKLFRERIERNKASGK